MEPSQVIPNFTYKLRKLSTLFGFMQLKVQNEIIDERKCGEQKMDGLEAGKARSTRVKATRAPPVNEIGLARTAFSPTEEG